MSHYAKLAGLQLVLWLNGSPCVGDAARLLPIRKTTKQGDFVWFAPKQVHGTWRGFVVPANLLPDLIATSVEISVGLDGERVSIPRTINRKNASSNGTVDIMLEGEPMVASCILKQHTVDKQDNKLDEPYVTVTPRVTRPNSNRTQVNSAAEVFGAS